MMYSRDSLKTRLNFNDALKLFEEQDLLKLGYYADIKRQELHPDNKPVTFVVDRNVNYTNICSCKCKFCAFYRDESQNDAYVLDYSDIRVKVQELIDNKGTQLLLQGGLNEDLRVEYYFNLIENLRRDFPNLSIHAFSPPEIKFIAQNNNLSIKELLQEFIHRGLSSIPGGGAEILSNKIRNKISPNKITADEWLEVMEIAHNLGLNTTATMVFGLGESYSDIIEHLMRIRDLQDKTNKFTAFIPWSFQPKNTELQSSNPTFATGYDYLKVLAISRIVLDNIPNIQASWVTQGLKVAQLSLRFGANDFGGTMIEENVVKSAGVEFRTTTEEIVKYINNAGFSAARRDTAYNILEDYDQERSDR